MANEKVEYPILLARESLDLVDALNDANNRLRAQTSLLQALALTGDGETEALIELAHLAEACLAPIDSAREYIERSEAHKLPAGPHDRPSRQRPTPRNRLLPRTDYAIVQAA